MLNCNSSKTIHSAFQEMQRLLPPVYQLPKLPLHSRQPRQRYKAQVGQQLQLVPHVQAHSVPSQLLTMLQSFIQAGILEILSMQSRTRVLGIMHPSLRQPSKPRKMQGSKEFESQVWFQSSPFFFLNYTKLWKLHGLITSPGAHRTGLLIQSGCSESRM